MSEHAERIIAADHVATREKAIAQIRDSLATLSYSADGFYEDEAQVALDALDWLEENTE